MGDHAVKAEVNLSGVWTDVTSEVKEASARTQRGFTQRGDIRPCKLDWTFEDPTDKWRPGNPTSSVYGEAGRALPARITADASVRCTGEITSFEPDQSPDFTASPLHGRRWVDITAEGVLSRISSWSTPLRSAMFRAIGQRSTLVGHWPGEDSRDATQLTNALPGGDPGSAIGIEFADDEAPGGSASSFSFTNADNTSKVFGKFEPASTTAGWQLAWSARLAALPGAGRRQMMSWRTSNGYHWAVNLDSGIYNLKVDDASGANLLDSDVLFAGFDPPDQWVTFRMKATASGGTITWEFAWYREGSDTNWGVGSTFSGAVGALSTWTANGNSAMQGAWMCHVYGVTTGADDLLDTDALAAFEGYVGELAGDRFLRLALENNLSATLRGNASETIPMGRQAPETLLKLYQEIADTEQGLIYDARGSVGVELRTRLNLYDQTAVNFTYPTHISPPMKESYDFVGVANLVTASQRDGGEATATLLTGEMSVQNSPDGIGEKKAGVDVNLGDQATLPDVAGWVLANGTLPGARYPQVTIDLDALPSLITAVNGISLGDLISITGRAQDVIYLLAIGIDEVINQKRRLVTFTCIPGAVYAQVGVYDDGVQRYDSASTTLKTTVTTTGTALVFRTADVDETWDTTAEPYDVMIAGERITVTVMGAAALVSGSYDQSATVTRSVNGIVKTLTAGEGIHIATPGRYAL